MNTVRWTEQKLPDKIVSGTHYVFPKTSQPYLPSRRWQDRTAGYHDLVFEFESGARVRGNGVNGETFGLSWFRNVELRGGDFSGGKNNLFANRGTGLRVLGVYSHHPLGPSRAGIGLLTGAVGNLLIEDYHSAFTPDHGLYVSEPSAGVTMRRIRIESASGAGLQINASGEGEGFRAPYFTTVQIVEDVHIWNQLRGAGLNLMGVHGTAAVPAVFRNVIVEDAKTHLGASCYDDGMPTKNWCEHLLFDHCKFLRTHLAAFQIHPSAKDIRLHDCELLSRGGIDLAGKAAELLRVTQPGGRAVRVGAFSG